MDKPDLIPLQDLDRGNPMIWEGEEQAQGVFLETGESEDPLALLGVPSLQLQEQPRLPADFEASPALRAVLETLRSELHKAAGQSRFGERIDVTGLDRISREALPLMLGSGEVCGRVALDGVDYTITEAVMAGLWHVTGSDNSEWLEVAPVPGIVEQAAMSLRAAPIQLPEQVPGVMNGLAVLAEVNEHASRWDGSEPHNRVLNFTLMPMSPEDQQLLIDVLGRADLVLESGGFGNCKLMATSVRHVWAVQYLNAMGNTILDTLEIGSIPDAALAAPEDFEDSARRLDQILETYLS
jgi:hydrogenase-1 operon protein HyaF